MRRLAAVAVVLGMAVALPACGHINETARAAGIVPTDAVAYASISLDPSLLQKKDLLQIGQKFPAARKLISGNFDVSRDNLLADAVKRVCLDYRADVKPWLGSELAVALLPPVSGGKAPAPVVFIKVNDASKAKRALDAATAKPCAGSAGRTIQYRFVRNFAVVVNEASRPDGTLLLDAVDNAAATGSGGLAATPAFANVVGQLASDRLAVGWLDTKALTKVLTGRSKGTGTLGVNLTGLANCDPVALGMGSSGGTVGFDIRATPSSLIFEGLAGGTAKAGTAGRPRLTEGLPADTLGETTVFGIGSLIRAALSCTGMADKTSAAFTKATGLDLNADVLALLGGEAVAVVGPVRHGAQFPDVGFVTAISDHAKAAVAVGHVVAAFRNRGTDLTQSTVAGVTAYTLTPAPAGAGSLRLRSPRRVRPPD